MSKIERTYDAIRREERAKQKARIEEAYAKIPALESIERGKTQAFLDVAAKKLPPDAAQKQIAALEEREQALLKENGFAPDALKLHYRCQTCRDTGFLGSGLKKPCACRLLLNAKLDPTVGINDTETFEAFSDSIYPSEAQKKLSLAAKRYCEGYADSLPDAAKPNLLLMGMAGLGKSYLGNAIAYRALSRGIDAVRTSAYVFVQDMLSDIRGEGNHSRRYRTAALLVIDDFGAEPLIPNVSEESFFAVINERILHRLPTVVSTNLDFTALQDRYGERVFSRLSDAASTRIIKLEGDNLRWRKPTC